MPDAPEHQSWHAFISYRRDGGAETARLLKLELKTRGIHAFLDVAELGTGLFDERLLRVIEAAPNFLVILTKGCLDRCDNPDDWLRKELAHAFATNRNVVPVFKVDFLFPAPAALPDDISKLSSHNGVKYDHDYFDAMIDKIEQFVREGLRRAQPAAPVFPSPVIAAPHPGRPPAPPPPPEPVVTAAERERQERALFPFLFPISERDREERLKNLDTERKQREATARQLVENAAKAEQERLARQAAKAEQERLAREAAEAERRAREEREAAEAERRAREEREAAEARELEEKRKREEAAKDQRDKEARKAAQEREDVVRRWLNFGR